MRRQKISHFYEQLNHVHLFLFPFKKKYPTTSFDHLQKRRSTFFFVFVEFVYIVIFSFSMRNTFYADFFFLLVSFFSYDAFLLMMKYCSWWMFFSYERIFKVSCFGLFFCNYCSKDAIVFKSFSVKWVLTFVFQRVFSCHFLLFLTNSF